MLLTLMAFEAIAGALVRLVVTGSTEIATSVTHTAPSLPHALTCTVCEPVAACTWAFTDELSTIVVSELLSREYPIAEIFCDEQALAFADRLKGEVTTASFAGLDTVTAAAAGITDIVNERKRVEIVFTVVF
jgi:hypothetical protein